MATFERALAMKYNLHYNKIRNGNTIRKMLHSKSLNKIEEGEAIL
jgi:hypothetical protein